MWVIVEGRLDSKKIRMENIFEKIPKVGEQILRQLDNQSLVRCKDVNGSWYKFIDSEKVLWFRIIQRCAILGSICFLSI